MVTSFWVLFLPQRVAHCYALKVDCFELLEKFMLLVINKGAIMQMKMENMKLNVDAN